MQLFGMARLQPDEWMRFQSNMMAQFYPLKRTDTKTGKEHHVMMGGLFREWRLFEYCIPKESFEQVVTSLNWDQGKSAFTYGGAMGKVFLPLALKGLKAKKIPFTKPTDKRRLLLQEGWTVEPIGFRDDVEVEFPYSIDQQLIPAYKGVEGTFRQEGI